MIFPSDNAHVSPVDLVPKMSNVACVLQCSGIWVGGKGWGLTWKLIQSIVKPREVVSVYGKCHIELSQEDFEKIEKQVVNDNVDEDMVDTEHVQIQVSSTTDVNVDDSDDEKVVPVVETKVPEPVQEVVKTVAKKVVKKKAP